MFVGLNLRLSTSQISNYIKQGKESIKRDSVIIHDDLKKYLIKNDALSAEGIIEDWFPSIEANIFISHSHKDIDIAYGLAGFLKQELGLKSFIDSSVWGYSNDLLKLIDNEYCLSEEHSDGSKSYDYNARNFSTSHVHMMLNGALMKMMDKTECLIFLNTPNTIVFRDDNYKSFTDSPWIYSELLMSQMLEKKKLKEYRKLIVQESFEHRADGISILYNIPIQNLYNVGFDDLMYVSSIPGKPYEKLDNLYIRLGIPDEQY